MVRLVLGCDLYMGEYGAVSQEQSWGNAGLFEAHGLRCEFCTGRTRERGVAFLYADLRPAALM